MSDYLEHVLAQPRVAHAAPVAGTRRTDTRGVYRY